jgi:hypothetical protein
MGNEWCKPEVQIQKEGEVIETEDILYEAVDMSLLRPEMLSFYMESRSNFPKNWYKYNPNLYLKPEQKLNKKNMVLFFLALMEYHVPSRQKESQFDKCMRELIYYPNVGIGYKSMLHAAVYKNIQHI